MSGRKKKYTYYDFEAGSQGEGFTLITLDMMSSRAWAALSPVEVTIYLILKSRFRRWRGENGVMQDNKDEIKLSCNDAAVLNKMSDKTFFKAIDGLISKGFIDCRIQSSKKYQPNVYKMSHRWNEFGTERFKPGKARIKRKT